MKVIIENMFFGWHENAPETFIKLINSLVVMLELLQRLGIAVYDFPSHAFLQIRQSVPAFASHHHVGNSLVLSHPLQCPRADFQ